jgi:CubicO group peptidase (beta-lactamase class C family)
MTRRNRAELADLLEDQVRVRRKAAGMVVGVSGPDGRDVVAHGVRHRDGSEPVGAGTVFEIASVSKIFTGLLLADMVRRGDVALTDSVEHHLPAGVQLPRRKGRQITLIDLATHTSGLPPQPADCPTLDDPVAAVYSRHQLFQAASRHQLTRDIGSEWQYGNVDIALLAHALAHRAQTDFDALLESRITRPLELADTALRPSVSNATRVASPHDSDLSPRPRLMLGALAPAGGMVSTAHDMLTLAEALLDLTPAVLNGLLPSMIATRRPIQPPLGRMLRDNWRVMLRMMLRPPRDTPPPLRYFTRAEAGLCWFVLGVGNDTVLVHDGAGPTCAASLALDLTSRTAVVVLSNAGHAVSDISRHVLRRDFPLSRARHEITPDVAILDRYVGCYRPRSDILFEIKRQGSRLLIALPVVGWLPLRAESERDFYVPEMGFEFRFPTGVVDELLFRSNAAVPMMPVKRVTDRT